MDFTTLIPDETLAYIFTHVQVAEPGTRRPHIVMINSARPSPKEVLGWIKITFVNRRWRQVAIDDATLWTHLNGELGWDWVNEFILRSKNATLSLDERYFPGGSDENEIPVADLVSAHHARLASLRLRALSPPSLTILDELLSNTFGELQWLNLLAEYVGSGSEPLRSLFTRTPRLRRLTLELRHLSYAALDWQFSCPSALTHLNIALDSDTSSAITPSFLDALRQMTALTHCVILEPSPSLLTSCAHRCSGTVEDLIRVPNMQSMVVTSSLETHAHMLRHVRLPSRTRLNLVGHNLAPNPLSSTYEALIQGLGSFLRAYEETPVFSSAYMAFNPLHIDDVAVNPDTISVSLGLSRDTRPRAFDVVYTEHENNLHEAHATNDFSIRAHDNKASNILPLLPLDHVRHLTLFNAGHSSTNAQLSHFPNIERLGLNMLSNNRYAHGIRILETPGLLPKLLIVDLHGEELDSIVGVLRNLADPTPGVPPTYSTLENVLRARRQMGSPLQAIYLHIAEDVAQTRATEHPVMLEVIERLEAIEGVKIVPKGFDVFAI